MFVTAQGACTHSSRCPERSSKSAIGFILSAFFQTGKTRIITATTHDYDSLIRSLRFLNIRISKYVCHSAQTGLHQSNEEHHWRQGAVNGKFTYQLNVPSGTRMQVGVVCRGEEIAYKCHHNLDTARVMIPCACLQITRHTSFRQQYLTTKKLL